MDENGLQQKIINLMSINKKMSFSELKHILGVSSNTLSYHLKVLQKKSVIKKENDLYGFGIYGEKIAPYVGQPFPYPIIVVLVAPINNNKVLLIKRKRQAFLGYWALLSNKLKFGETPDDTVKRTLDEYPIKYDNIQFKRVISEIDVEGKDKKLKFHFVFLLYKVFVKSYNGNELKWFDIDKLNKVKKIIPSDVLMIKRIADKNLGQTSMLVSPKKLKLLFFR